MWLWRASHQSTGCTVQPALQYGGADVTYRVYHEASALQHKPWPLGACVASMFAGALLLCVFFALSFLLHGGKGK